MMLAHNFPRLIQGLIFEAIIRFFTMIPRTRAVSGSWPEKGGSLPLRVFALHRPNQMIT